MTHWILALILGATALAQAPEPEYVDTPHAISGGQLVPLERQSAAFQTKASGFIVMNAKASVPIPGAASPVRFRAGQSVSFIVRPSVPSIDPSTVYFLRRLGAGKKKTRELVLTTLHASPIGASIKNKTRDTSELAFEKYGAASIKITSPALDPGEYAIWRQGGQSVFCFGID